MYISIEIAKTLRFSFTQAVLDLHTCTCTVNRYSTKLLLLVRRVRVVHVRPHETTLTYDGTRTRH